MKRIVKSLFILLSVFLYFACTPEEEDIFEKSSANRIEATLKACNDILVGAPNGWLMEYYPASSQQYGGYNVLVSFTSDGKSTVASETYGADETATGFYSLKQSAGLVLTFDTYNKIMHFFSDPANPARIGTNGKGMEGDFEFSVMKAKSDSIILKGKKTGSKIIMTPLTSSVKWDDYLSSLEDLDTEYTVYNSYQYVDGSFKADVTMKYRTFEISYLKDEATVTLTAPFIILADGSIKFYKTIELNGQKIDKLTYKKVGNLGVFVPANYTSATFTPVPPNVNKVLVEGDWYMTMSGLGATGKASWNYTKTNTMPVIGQPLHYILLTPYSATQTALYWEWGVNHLVGYLAFGFTLSGKDRITFASAAAGNNNGVNLWNNYQWSYMAPFINRTFTLTSDDPFFPTKITMTDTANPNNTIEVYSQEILDPFNN